jgi:protein translocase SecG subunit
MRQTVGIIQIFISILLIGLILIQAKGTGLGRTTGMGSTTSFTRRGLEKLIFRMTFVVAAAFLVGAIVLLWL